MNRPMTEAEVIAKFGGLCNCTPTRRYTAGSNAPVVVPTPGLVCPVHSGPEVDRGVERRAAAAANAAHHPEWPQP